MTLEGSALHLGLHLDCLLLLATGTGLMRQGLNTPPDRQERLNLGQLVRLLLPAEHSAPGTGASVIGLRWFVLK